jgi:hypothetical protein
MRFGSADPGRRGTRSSSEQPFVSQHERRRNLFSEHVLFHSLADE